MSYTGIWGDSIAVGLQRAYGLGGQAKEGLSPSAIANMLEQAITANPSAFRGARPLISSGLSNNPQDIEGVRRQIQLLKNAGANPSFVGLASGRYNTENNLLSQLTRSSGVGFLGGFKPGADSVHPESYSNLYNLTTSSTSKPNSSNMARITLLGQLGSTGVSSGPHLHTIVKNLKTGEYEDPGIHRSKFLNVRIGPNRVPKYIADGKGGLILNPAAGLTMTSGWGPRNTGIPGASTFHQGRDYAGAKGTEIFVEGDIKFTPRPNSGGYGNLATWTTPDGLYELGYGHMKTLGEAADLTEGKVTDPSGAGFNPKEFLTGYLLGTGLVGEPKESGMTTIKRQLVKQLLQPQETDMFSKLLMSMPNPYAV